MAIAFIVTFSQDTLTGQNIDNIVNSYVQFTDLKKELEKLKLDRTVIIKVTLNALKTLSIWNNQSDLDSWITFTESQKIQEIYNQIAKHGINRVTQTIVVDDKNLEQFIQDFLNS
jgi:hypothetical protein